MLARSLHSLDRPSTRQELACSVSTMRNYYYELSPLKLVFLGGQIPGNESKLLQKERVDARAVQPMQCLKKFFVSYKVSLY